ncbi:MAG: transketolase [DPANN group archaeon]|nr:transketolase [DPANN group archaeon]
MTDETDLKFLEKKALETRIEALRMHKKCKEIRIASCLSDIEIFTTLFYGKILKFDPKNPLWDGRDRFVSSKAHGTVSLYPVLADLGFFDKKELLHLGENGSFLPGSIPDPRVPGFETFNGSLGHGLGVGSGMALGLKQRKSESKVFVLMGDGELYEGSVWEAVMFAGQHKLDNLILVLDYNKLCMLGYCKDIIDLSPLDKKFEAFGWKTKVVDGHNVAELYSALYEFKMDKGGKPKILIANTVKGKGVPRLETDPLCHIKSLEPAEVDALIMSLNNGHTQ